MRVRPRGFVGRRAPDPLRCPGWIPAFAGMTERGAQAPSGPGARRFTGKSAQELRARSGGGAARRSGWGRGGAAPTGRKSEGGWVGRSGAQRTLVRDGDGGVGGAAPRRGLAGCARSPSPPPSPARAVVSRGGRLRPDARKPRRPHTPPRRSTQGLEAALAGGGLCRVGCGVPPQALASMRAAPAPPHPRPLPQGARGPASEARCALESSGWGRGGAAPTERKSEGGWVGLSRAARSSGMGVCACEAPTFGAHCWWTCGESNPATADEKPSSPHQRQAHTRSAPAAAGALHCNLRARGDAAGPPLTLTPARSARAAPAPPHPHPLPQGARGPASEARCALETSGWGRGGAAPTERKSEGGWVGQSRAARSSGMGVWGAQPPAGDARSATDQRRGARSPRSPR